MAYTVSQVSDVRQAGLRLQIVLALAGLMVLAFVPLYFAVASLARATVLGAREEAARSLGRAIAVHVAAELEGEALERDGRGAERRVERVLEAQAASNSVQAVCAFAGDGQRIACAGLGAEVAALQPPRPGRPESTALVHGAAGWAIEVLSSAGDVRRPDVAVVTRVRLSDAAVAGAALVRLVALYMIVFALALLVFAYFALTRLIVRPVEQLVEAADRVAGGARTLRVPKRGPRELTHLAASVESMAAKLIAEEAKLQLTLDEVTETTTRLTHAQAQLARSERMASVGRLAAGLAHEIGNPIAALMGMIDLLLAGDLPPETQTDFLRRMQKETERIHRVLRDLLDFARPDKPLEGEAARTDAAPASATGEKAAPIGSHRTPSDATEAADFADVASVVADVVALVKPQKSFRGVDVEADVSPALRARVAAPRLTQVLLNLVVNAGAAIAGARAAKPARGRVTVRAREAGRARLRIEVEDNGPGVAPAVRDRLFEPFVTTKDVGEGTGLGLAVCRGLVESVGGAIVLDPSYEQGARFVVLLPAEEREERE
jgi:signal transduction histidine kinase